MRKTIVKILSSLLLILFIFSFGKISAINNSGLNGDLLEYTEDYQRWLELSDEERKQTLEPRKFDIIIRKDNASYLKGIDNVFRIQQLLKANVSQNYDLRDEIPENVKIRNQKSTNSCWAFATIGVLESNLAIRDKIASRPVTTYDFSEKHMNYTTAKRSFLDDKINEYGYDKELSDGGNFYTATQYLSNGQGAINESDLPFVDSEENIDISEIQNKEVVTTLYDTVEFPSLTASERDEVMPSMKQHIVNYGGIYAGIHGAELSGDGYNNETGAIYCTSTILEAMDHAVVIIGWDDNYSKDNFNENQRPSEDGAWIIKNSWGENIIEDLTYVKEMLFEELHEEMGWNSPDDILTDQILGAYKSVYGEDKVSIQGDNIVTEIGNGGYMYISYEDCNVYKNLMGIEKATNTKDYDYVYQNDMLGASAILPIIDSGNIFLANVFTRDSNKREALDKISIYTNQGYTCKVFVNPNGSSKAKEDLQEVKLKEGDTVSFEAGYHTIEFAEPLELKGDSFVVVVQVVDEGTTRYIALETKVDDTAWAEAIVNAEESFYTNESRLEQNDWDDIGTTENVEGNLCIKAYTTSNFEEQKTLAEIYIETQPTKTSYVEGENFDKSGMKVIARYSDDSTHEITDYIIIDGENLTIDKTNVTIQYTENGIIKTTSQEITVNEKEEPATPEEPERNPVASNFDNAESIITEAKIYFNSEDLTDVSSDITIKISGIEIGDETNTYKHYYYISGTQGDKDITDWKETKLTRESDGTYSITLKIKTEEINNLEEIAESENLYVYIREIAQIDQKEVENIITLQAEDQSEVECYVDGEYMGNIDDFLEYNNSNNTNNSDINQNRDNTVVTICWKFCV